MSILDSLHKQVEAYIFQIDIEHRIGRMQNLLKTIV